MLRFADKELTDAGDTLDQSQRDVEKLSSLVDEYVAPGEKGCLDADEHLYFGTDAAMLSIHCISMLLV